MQKKWMRLALLALLVTAITGCTTQAPPEPEPEPPEMIAATVDPRLVGEWTSLALYTDDLDGDGGSETVELLTAAQRDRKGEIMWDDGQNWLLLVEDGDKVYPLFAGYVQLGSLYFTVNQTEDGGHEIIALHTAGAGFNLSRYTWAGETGYAKSAIYDAGAINQMFTSFPGYR